MESIPENPLLEFPPDLITIVRKEYNLDQPGRMAEAVDILEEWVKKQEHFTKKDFSRAYLESTIINSKGSLERAKSQMDKLCTYRTLWPKLFEIIDAKELAPFMNILTISVLPKLTKENYRVIWVKLRKTDFKPSDFVKFSNCMFCLLDYNNLYDYPMGYVCIFDYVDINVADLIPKIILTDLQQLITVVTDGYGARIKNVLILTQSKVIDGFIKLIRPFISDKIGNRIQVCKTVDDVCEFVPREILPAEYGGTARTCREIAEHWTDILSSEENINCFNDLKNARIDESFRPNDKHNDKYMGMPGTFRTLRID